MSVTELSVSAQNYLKVIWGLSERSAAPATTTDRAERMGLRPSTVSDGLKRLTEQGLVDHAPYGAARLTEKGREYALAMVRRHRLIESFLVQSLRYSWDQVHDEAEQLEHAVSDFMVDRIDEFLGFPKWDPHGDPIPGADGSMPEPSGTLLATVATGAAVVLERVSDSNPELLKYLAESGIGIGQELHLRPGRPFSDTIEVFVGGASAPIVLGPAAAQAMWVSPAQTTS